MLHAPEDVNHSWFTQKNFGGGINHAGPMMRNREPRRQVLIHARMRAGTAWVDVCIRNMSSRGLLGQTQDPPLPGTYVEIRRGAHVIIGRCVWRKDRDFGVRTQDKLNVDAIIAEPVTSGAGQYPPERRSDPERIRPGNLARQLDRSRQTSAAIQFLFVVCLGMVAAGLAASLVHEILSRPIRVIETGLQS